MEEQLQEDWLDARLREEAPYIDDAGFTARVVHQLPAPQRSRRVRTVILLGFTIIATLVAYLASDRGTFLADTAAFMVAMPLVTVCVIAGLTAMIVTAVGASAAISKTRELRP
jgi:Ca2+/H+ antiporter